MRGFHNLKISGKLILGFIMVAIISALVGGVGIYSIQKVSDMDTELYEKATVPLAEMIGLTNDYQSMRIITRDIIIHNDSKTIEANITKFNSYSESFDETLLSLNSTMLTENGKKVSNDLQVDKDAYVENVINVFQLMKENKVEEASETFYTNGSTVAANLEESITQLKDLKINIASDMAEKNNKTTAFTSKLELAIVIFGVIVALSLGFIISYVISKPIKKMVTISEEIAKGNLDITIEYVSKDEIGVLANSFRNMLANLNEVMRNIGIASEQVATGARQVSDTSVMLSQGATEQASSIEELTASMEEIAAQTRQNAEHANEANSLASSVKGNAVQGNESMKEMQKAMEEINVSSNNIAKIIKVIDEIAFQTNILALNAAVEAARAGQHGKGFAVVAEEVRNLAARSADAAKETTVMIESAIKKVEGGTGIANQTANALNTIVSGVEKVANLVDFIAIASNEQALGIEQANQGIMQVSTVIQSNSTTSQESAAASEELTTQADLLKNQMERFKLKKDYIYNTHTGSEEVNPELLMALERMKMKKNMEEHNMKSKIILSDNEFGKY
jgi:methyl-accepting chemotaxis protein